MDRRWIVCAFFGLAACAFEPRGAPDDGAVIDGPAGLDGADLDATDATPRDGNDIDGLPPLGRSLVDDSVGDFGQGTTVLDEVRIEADGTVSPRAYYVGSLCAAGSDSLLFTDGQTATGAVLPANPTKIGLARTVDLDLASNGIPPGVGITNADNWTLWWFGELFLTTGTHTIALRADDHGFVELRAPGAAMFTGVIGVNFDDNEQQATYSAPVTGWYAVRLAVAQVNGPVELYARLDGQAIPRRLTRCRVDGYTGLAETGFDESGLLDVVGTTIEQSQSAANIDWVLGSPSDLGVTSADSFSVRWAGQFFIEIAGSYQLRVRSDDGYRLWIDGAKVLDDLSDGVHDLTTSQLAFARGWHDLIYDVSESTFGARSQLSVAAGPELVGSAFPPARLRPAEGRFERFESATAASISEPGPAMFGFDPTVGAIVTGVDTGYALHVNNGFSNVTTTLGTAVASTTLRNNTGTGDTVDRHRPIAFDNLAFAPLWGLGFDVANGGGLLTQSWLTVRYRGAAGTGPTPVAASYQSSVRDLLGPGGATVVAIDQLAFVTRAAAGATVTIAVRTCDAPAGCASQAYSPGYLTGATPAVTPRRYVQYRIDFATDGDHEPAVERVQLDYRTQ